MARRISHDLSPKKVVIASLYPDEVQEALDGSSGLRRMFSGHDIEFVGEHGDVFVRDEFSDRRRSSLLESYDAREKLYEDLHGPLDGIYYRSRLVQLILEHRPDVIVDTINTATAISYQDFYSASVLAKKQLDTLFSQLREHQLDNARAGWKESERLFETLLLSASMPQLIRHVLLLNRAMREVGTRLYLKVGTTGTGGMGLNIPYTHSEDKPSVQLLTKSAIAFAHTGLLFLMARTVGGPIVKEIKPGAMIGYADITCRTIRQHGHPVKIYASRTFPLDGTLPLRIDGNGFEMLGELDLPVVDTGENGLFTRGEFETITSLRQMEFITPEEIALECALEIRGSNTGRDVIAAIDGAVMSPTYRAGVLRQHALQDLARLEKATDTHSVALGQLGPPELSKLLWEAELLKQTFGTVQRVLEESPESLSAATYTLLQENPKLQHTINSIGVPILTPDHQLIRGPIIKIPEAPGQKEVAIGEGDLDRWAAKGWVDLRPGNFSRWRERFENGAGPAEDPHARLGCSDSRRLPLRRDPDRGHRRLDLQQRGEGVPDQIKSAGYLLPLPFMPWGGGPGPIGSCPRGGRPLLGLRRARRHRARRA